MGDEVQKSTYGSTQQTYPFRHRSSSDVGTPLTDTYQYRNPGEIYIATRERSNNTITIFGVTMELQPGIGPIDSRRLNNYYNKLAEQEAQTAITKYLSGNEHKQSISQMKAEGRSQEYINQYNDFIEVSEKKWAKERLLKNIIERLASFTPAIEAYYDDAFSTHGSTYRDNLKGGRSEKLYAHVTQSGYLYEFAQKRHQEKAEITKEVDGIIREGQIKSAIRYIQMRGKGVPHPGEEAMELLRQAQNSPETNKNGENKTTTEERESRSDTIGRVDPATSSPFNIRSSSNYYITKNKNGIFIFDKKTRQRYDVPKGIKIEYFKANNGITDEEIAELMDGKKIILSEIPRKFKTTYDEAQAIKEATEIPLVTNGKIPSPIRLELSEKLYKVIEKNGSVFIQEQKLGRMYKLPTEGIKTDFFKRLADNQLIYILENGLPDNDISFEYRILDFDN